MRLAAWVWLPALLALDTAAAGIPASGQSSCVKMDTAPPDSAGQHVDRYEGWAARQIVRNVAGVSFPGDQLLAVVGEDDVWLVVVRNGLGCPIQVNRRTFEEARRRVVGTAG